MNKFHRFNELSNIQINRYFKNNKDYGGTYSKDELPPIKNRFYIINMSDLVEKGTHFIMVYNCRLNYCIYYDSFGVLPPQDVMKFMFSTGKTIIYNDTQQQSLTSSLCGYYCCYVIDKLQNGLQPSSIMKTIEKKTPDENDSIIKKYFITKLKRFV